MDEKTCEVRHKDIDKDLDRHQKWLGTMQNDINFMQEERGAAKEAMKNVNKNIKEVKNTQFWIMGLIVTQLLAYFFSTQGKVLDKIIGSINIGGWF
jgi:archaellum component FlaC